MTVRALISLAFALLALPAVAQESRATLEGQVAAGVIDNQAQVITPKTVRTLLLNILASVPTLVDNPGTGNAILTTDNVFTGLNTFTPPPPAWDSFTGTYAGISSNLGSMPSSAYTITIPAAAAIAGYIDIPSTETRLGISGAVYGVARTASPNFVGVGGLFVGTVDAPNVQAWGSNILVSNTPSFNAQPQTGIAGASLWGLEVDMNFEKLPGGANPGGTGRALLIGGNSEVAPSGGIYGIEIESASAFAAPNSVAWTAALIIDGAPNGSAIFVGPNAASGNSLGSQSISLASISNVGALQQETLSTDSAGDFFLGLIPTGTFVVRGSANEFQVQPGSVNQFSPNGAHASNYATDNSGNTVISSGAVGGAIKFEDSTPTTIATIGSGSPGTATKTVVADSSGNWFSQAGFSGTKTAGSCVLTILAGSITNVTGC